MIIGMGMDIQAIDKFERSWRRGGKTFIQKLFTGREYQYCQHQRKSGQHLAARFCAKEAFFKALGTGWDKGMKWNEVEVVRRESGQPTLRLSGKAAAWSRRLRVKKIWVSLSHTEGYAAAIVVLEGNQACHVE